jgi:hypothetical protein
MEHGHNNLKILAIILGPLLDGAAYATISPGLIVCPERF